MNRLYLFILISIFSFSINKSYSQDVRAFLSYNEFYSPKDGQYIESNLSIEGSSLTWLKTGDVFSSKIEVTVIFKLDSAVIAFSKDIITSDARDSSEMKQVFMHSNKYLLKNGDYKIDIKLDDLNDSSKAIFSVSEFVIDNPIDSVYTSSIELLSNVEKAKGDGPNVKSGYELTPNVYRYLNEQDSVLYFYSEVYNSSKKWGEGSPYIVTYYLIDNTILKEVPSYRRYKRIIAAEVNVLLESIDIRKLKSGNYSLVMEVRDRDNKIVSSRDNFFKRSNDDTKLGVDEVGDVQIAKTFVELIKGKDTLRSIIRTFRPISSVQEQSLAETVISDGSEYIMQQYIYSFWENRNIKDPFGAFKKYMARIRECDKLYASRIKRGYETSRGRVFIQYGKANSITREYHDPAAYPYEVWHYYQARGQRNIKFVFFNTDLSSNEFELLHSTAAGERSDYQWRIRLRRDRRYQSIDDTGNKKDEWGSQYNKIYENPR